MLKLILRDSIENCVILSNFVRVELPVNIIRIHSNFVSIYLITLLTNLRNESIKIQKNFVEWHPNIYIVYAYVYRYFIATSMAFKCLYK